MTSVTKTPRRRQPVQRVPDMPGGDEPYRRLVELALDFTCVCVGGVVSFVNLAGLRFLGVADSAQVVGRPLQDWTHADYSAVFDDGLGVLAEERDPLPLKFVRADGRVIDAEVKVMPLDEAADAYMVEARDLSEIKRAVEALRDREERLQGIMDTVADGIVAADETGTVQSFNPAAERIFGYSAGEVVGRSMNMLMSGADASAHDDHIAHYLRSGETRIMGVGRELTARRKDGTAFPIELNVSELRRGRHRLFIGTIRDITQRKQAEEALRRAHAELEQRVEERTRELAVLSRQTTQILNSANEGILGLDDRACITFANPAAARLTGWPLEELRGLSLHTLLGRPRSREGSALTLFAVLRRGQAQRDMAFRRRGGESFPVEFAAAPIAEDGRVRGAVVVFRDVTERRRAEDKLRLAAKVFETTAEGIIVCNGDFCVTAVNPAFTEITGYAAEEALGRLPQFLTEADAGLRAAIEEAVESRGRWEGELWSRRKDGRKCAERLAVSSVSDAPGASRQYVVVFSDITQRKMDEERIRYQANYDALTALPNRTLFLDRLQQALAAAARSGERVGLMFVDLDGFKLVNDTLGHEAGDALLREAAKRLQDCVRAGDTVARLGGDEFTVIMPNLGSARNAPAVAQRIIQSLCQPFHLEDRDAFVSASIGITSYPDDGGDSQTLLKNADAAMYRAKEQGKATYQFFTAELNRENHVRLAIKNGLDMALERQEFVLYYQPKVSLATDAITGVEALLRWRNKDMGMVDPSRFIPVMEETGMIAPVGEWVMEAACRQYRAWREQGLPDLRVAVNLSVRQIRQPGLAKTVQDVLDRTGVPPAGLELEITESMIMKDTERAVTTLQELHEMGVTLAIDDFGTGYSSLSYLKRFPLHTIKIDRSFVRDLATDSDDVEIVRTIISMGHSLRRRVVAEGVETKRQREALRQLRCDEIQGYLISAPVPPERLDALLREGVIA